MIPPGRIKAIPGVSNCVTCAEKIGTKVKAEFKLDKDAPHPRGW